MSLIKSFFTVSGATLASRILGFVRDVLMAKALGTSVLADAFFIAFKLPNLFRRLFAEGALHVSFLPIYKKIKETRGDEEAHTFACLTLSWLLVIMAVLTALGILFMPALVYVIAPGFSAQPDIMAQTILLARITFPYLPLIVLVSFAASISNAHKRFFAAAAAPILLNTSFIVLLWISLAGTATEVQTATLSAIAVPVGGLLQLLLMVVALKKINFKLYLLKPRKTPDISTLLYRMGPALLTVGVLQISTLIDTILATFLPDGSVSYLFYADRLNQLPLALIGIALSTVLLPLLSGKSIHTNVSRKGLIFSKIMVVSFALALPASVGLAYLSQPIITLLFERGSFDSYSSQMTAYALSAYALGLPAMILLKVTATQLFAEGDTKSPFAATIAGLGINLIGNLILMQYLSHTGLALATSLSAYCQLGIQLYLLHRKHRITLSIKYCINTIKCIFIMLITFFIFEFACVIFVSEDSFYKNLLWISIYGVLCASVYSAGCWFIRVLHLPTIKRLGSDIYDTADSRTEWEEDRKA